MFSISRIPAFVSISRCIGNASPSVSNGALVQFLVNVCFYRRMVFWALCRQDCGPKLGSGYYFFGQRSDVELILLNLLCQLYAADRHGRRLELLESEHRPDSPFYPAMVLLDDIV